MKDYRNRFIKNFQKLSGVMLNESFLFEGDERRIYDDIAKMFMENNFRNGMFVSLGYINSVEIPKRIFPSSENEQSAMSLIKDAQNENLSNKEVQIIKSLIEDKTWSDTKSGSILNTKKQPKKYFDMPSEYASIIQFNRYTFNWMDMDNLSRNFDSQRKSEIELRKRFGFGKGEDEYSDTDWRKKMGSTGRPKYRGITLDPSIDMKDNNRGSSYKQKIGDFPLYGDVDMEGNPRIDPVLNQQRMALRQNISTGLSKPNTMYFYVDNEGNLHQVSYKFVKFLSEEIKEVKSSKDIVDDLADDEAEFVKEMEILNKKYFVTQFLTNRIAYMTATVIDDKTKEKKPIYFKNNNIEVLDDIKINKQQIDSLISKFIKEQL